VDRFVSLLLWAAPVMDAGHLYDVSNFIASLNVTPLIFTKKSMALPSKEGYLLVDAVK
jgi:hypothetical protein